MKIVSVVGARPQFIKAAPVGRALRAAGHTEVLVHTGQHYDESMSAVFFRELQIPEPDYNLGVGSGSHGRQTGEMLQRIEDTLLHERPDCVVVYGDTNSTLAAALAAVKLQIPVAHVESGLRSFNRTMPEEHNRVLVDHCADVLFCPTRTAVDNLEREGFTRGVFLVGDTMYDAVLQFSPHANQAVDLLGELGLGKGAYSLATIHRPYNTDVDQNLQSLLLGLDQIGEPVIFPVHPRTSKRIEMSDTTRHLVAGLRNVRMISPVGYQAMLGLQRHARLVLTDSGGIQKEAYLLGIPCVTLRPETEWQETVEAGWNVVVGADRERLVKVATRHRWPEQAPPPVFGDGMASERIVRHLEAHYGGGTLPGFDVSEQRAAVK